MFLKLFLLIYIYEKLLKNLWKRNIVFQTILSLRSPLAIYSWFFFEKIPENKILYFKLFVTQISRCYIFMKIFWKFYGNKTLYYFRVIPSYLLLRFSVLIYFWKFIKKCLKTKCCINLIFWIMSSYLIA